MSTHEWSQVRFCMCQCQHQNNPAQIKVCCYYACQQQPEKVIVSMAT